MSNILIELKFYANRSVIYEFKECTYRILVRECLIKLKAQKKSTRHFSHSSFESVSMCLVQIVTISFSSSICQIPCDNNIYLCRRRTALRYLKHKWQMMNIKPCRHDNPIPRRQLHTFRIPSHRCGYEWTFSSVIVVFYGVESTQWMCLPCNIITEESKKNGIILRIGVTKQETQLQRKFATIKFKLDETA